MTTDDSSTPPSADRRRPVRPRSHAGSARRALGALALLAAATWATDRLSGGWRSAPRPAVLAAPDAPSGPAPALTMAPLRILAQPPLRATGPGRGLAAAFAHRTRMVEAERRARLAAAARSDTAVTASAVERLLRRYNGDRALTRRIASAVVRESRRARLDPALVTAVLVAENDALRPKARNAGTRAHGLMQVMPGWAGRLGCGSSDLSDVDANICHGVRVLAAHLKEAGGDQREGLRLYNGCRRTPGSTRCDAYPTRVLAHAKRLNGQIAALTGRQAPKTAVAAR